jgi:hypothetical protein
MWQSSQVKGLVRRVRTDARVRVVKAKQDTVKRSPTRQEVGGYALLCLSASSLARASQQCSGNDGTTHGRRAVAGAAVAYRRRWRPAGVQQQPDFRQRVHVSVGDLGKEAAWVAGKEEGQVGLTGPARLGEEK